MATEGHPKGWKGVRMRNQKLRKICPSGAFFRSTPENMAWAVPIYYSLRERPFNLKGGYGFFLKKIFWFPMLLKKIFWFWWRKKKIIWFRVCRAKCEIFFQNSTLGYIWQKLWIRLFFFSSTKIRIFFSATLGIRIFFLEKKKCSCNEYFFLETTKLKYGWLKM
jgi:hypothetical protein